MNSPARQSITRQDFLKKFVNAVPGLKYDDAAKIYSAMGELFADAIVCGRKISVERVLAIHPVKRKARKVTMGCHGTKQTLYLSDRLGFKVKVFRKFLEKRDLRWQL